MKLGLLRYVWNFWPPFLGMGIKIKYISEDFKKIIVLLKKRKWNANYFGTQYGGAIFSMTDGIYVVMLLKHLPKKIHIWDKSARIEYLKRGLTDLTAEFILSDEDINFIKKMIQTHESFEWKKTIEIKDKQHIVVAKIERVLSIKKKN